MRYRKVGRLRRHSQVLKSKCPHQHSGMTGRYRDVHAITIWIMYDSVGRCRRRPATTTFNETKAWFIPNPGLIPYDNRNQRHLWPDSRDLGIQLELGSDRVRMENRDRARCRRRS